MRAACLGVPARPVGEDGTGEKKARGGSHSLTTYEKPTVAKNPSLGVVWRLEMLKSLRMHFAGITWHPSPEVPPGGAFLLLWI